MFIQIMKDPEIIINVFHIKSIEPEFGLADGAWVYKKGTWLVHVGEKTYHIDDEQKNELMKRLCIYHDLIRRLSI